MRVVAYSIKTEEKESLARANQKKHDITLISNPLSRETLHYAAGKEAVLIGADDHFDEYIRNEMAAMGIHYVLMRCPERSSSALQQLPTSLQVDCLSNPNLQEESIKHMAQETIHKLDAWQKVHGYDKLNNNEAESID